MTRISFLVSMSCVVCSIAPALGGVAVSEGAYALRATTPAVVAWITKNRVDFYRAANAEILEARGSNRYLVRSGSPIGSSTYIVEERLTQKGERATWQIALVEKVSGRVADMQATVVIVPRGQGSEVTMTTKIDFDHLLATSRAVKRVSDKSIKQTRELLVQNVHD